MIDALALESLPPLTSAATGPSIMRRVTDAS